MTLLKSVAGKAVAMTAEEEAATRAQWAENERRALPDMTERRARQIGDEMDRLILRRLRSSDDLSDIRAAYQAALKQLDAATTLDEARAVTVAWPPS